MGLFNLVIGRGTPVLGDFSLLDWGSGNRFVQVSVTIGSETYNFAQTELQAVPYAKMAERTLLGDGDASPTNEIQSLSINGNQLSISSGNTVTLPVGSSGPTYTAGPGIASPAQPSTTLATLTLGMTW